MDEPLKNEKFVFSKFVKIAAILIIAIALTVLFYWPEKKSVSVVVQKITVQKPLFLRGVFASGQPYSLDANNEGHVTDVFLRDGHVELGEKILRLSNAKLELELLSRQASIVEQINQTEAIALQTTISLENANSEVRKNSIELELAQIHEQKLLQLFKLRYVSELEYLTSKAQVRALRESLESNNQKAKEYKSLQSASSARSLVSIRQLSESLTSVGNLRDALTLRAPATGRLTLASEIETGSYISLGAKLGQISLAGSMIIVAYVDEFQLGITPNQKVEEVNGTLRGAIKKVHSNVENGQYRVDIALEGSTDALLGSSITVKLEGRENTLLVVPNNKLGVIGKHEVYIRTTKGAKEKKTVEFEILNEEWVEIKSGGKEGEEITIPNLNR